MPVKKTNEFDDLFSDAPTKAPAATEKTPVTVEGEKAPVAVENNDDFKDLFLEDGNTPLPDTSSDKSVAAAVGAGYGAYKGLRKTVPTSDNAYTRWAERTYGLPEGSLAEVSALRDPSMPMTEAQANKAVASKYFGASPCGGRNAIACGHYRQHAI